MVIFNHHYQEWEESAIAREIIEANLESVPPYKEPENPWEMDKDELPEAFYLLHPEPENYLERRNDGRLTDKSLRTVKAEYLVNGGWIGIGFDLTTGERDIFLCFKSESPRTNKEGKTIKYEHPKGMSTGIFAPAIPHAIANTIAFRAGAKTFAKWEQFRDSYQGDPEFAIWEFAKTTPDIELNVTEGFKKASSLISQGFLTVGLPGIWNWIDKDAPKYTNLFGETKRKKELTKLLKPLLGGKREITLWFDEDSKPKTIQNVNLAQKVLGKALSKEGCKVFIAEWDAQDGKGIDDAIAANGKDWLEKVYQRRKTLSAWIYFQQSINEIDRHLNKQFLTQDDVDAAATLIGIKSGKGTNKTGAIADYIQQYLNEGKPVMLLSHRVQLVRELSERLGIDNAYNFRVSETKGVLGLALCVDSLHCESRVQFNPHNWDDYVLVVDEVEQVIPHTLISKQTTVADYRVEVLANLTTLAQNASQIILSDADLSDRALNYFHSLVGNCSQKIIKNDFQPANGRKLFNHPSPECWLTYLHHELDDPDSKILIPCDAQQAKSKWGSQTLEAYIRHHFPNRKVLRIDSETIENPEHSAYGCIDHLDEVLSHYDVVIYTSVLGTGVSIDLKGHFDAVYSINEGTQSENSTRQFLARLRDNVPRHCYFKTMGVNSLDGGETETRAVQKSNKAITKRNLSNLSKLENTLSEALDFDSFHAHTDAYCAYIANHNLGLSAYREIVLEGLRREGYEIIEVPELLEDDERKTLGKEVSGIRDKNYDQLTSAIAETETPSDSELKELENKQSLTDSQRHKLRKGKMENLYGVEADKELIEQDDEGLYSKLALLFWLTVARDHVAETDLKKAQAYKEKTGGKGYSPDFNRTQYQAKIEVLEVLKIPDIIAMEGQEVSNQSLQWWWEHIQNLIAKHYNTQTAVKRFLGVTLSEKETPIQNLRRLLERSGFQLTYCYQMSEGQGRHRVYRIEKVTNKQDAIFAHWQKQLSQENYQSVQAA